MYGIKLKNERMMTRKLTNVLNDIKKANFYV